MLEFTIDRHACTGCGQCSFDCPARIIVMEQGLPRITPENEASCYRCQHCLTICPTGAVSILGLKAENSRPLAGRYPDPEQLETLMKGRRSIRRYKEEALEPELLQHLLEVAWHAPTGINSRQVRFTVVTERAKMVQLRDDVLAGVARLEREQRLPAEMAFFANFVRLWQEEQVDVIFRGAPHLLIASVPPDVASPLPDCLIALSYFELFAQANGVGTVWNGLAKWAINDLLPETRTTLEIPAGHLIGYVMAFGRPAAHFARTAQHGPALIHKIHS